MKTSTQLKKMKQENQKIAMLTAYDYPSAKLAQDAGVDMILVGDSLGMVVLGYDSTIPVTVEDMIHHGKAVKRGATDTFTVIDMPFMSYHISEEETMKQAMRMMQETGAEALKLEGAGDVISIIGRLTKGGIPVVGHLGLTPQSVHVLGGYRVQGKDSQAAEQLISDAVAIQQQGAIGLVLECVPKQLAREVQQKLHIPVIGIGAGVECDGQVLVYHDLIQYGVDRLPKFVQSYLNANEQIKSSISAYIKDVHDGTFPNDEQSFHMKEESLPRIYGGQSDGNH
ncbi:3-methyl-2-oxobutanoate hydroxymethyltransferase [Pontibacillus yanchengensis]|uniref:3-methyl-2-oxobutanoate hydroxymethyltransferase n=1 Tax=Pontibacillus yanchengensis Y32 TaxID=1385514 RepID=A0A0A2TF25_9BACI|nr:3-methyl-2-oxobutanoate hydroxymethyltransferase [Pontibacillus yanchengensis]KGP73033.1 3-methyl-2-oxobutanoate hydroxymethyltransferase [Pontibacillus yanchengensis Y32]